ncbi:MAG: hypothetical protein H0X13_06100 [Ramlibacter sp.]|nr:hypothetical protein [Ramlibacter sp.]
MNADASPADALSHACTALWAATLSLMTAFMHNPAPAHRLLLARRISRNFATLREEDCFSPASRASFAKLSRHWGAKADQLAGQHDKPLRGLEFIQSFWKAR